MCYYIDYNWSTIETIAEFRGWDYAGKIIELRARKGNMFNGFANPEVVGLSSPGIQPSLMKWGLIPSWTKTEENAKKFARQNLNARCETIFKLPSFRASAKTQRCIIPTTGFYEWRHEGGQKLKHCITRTDDPVMFLGGLWSEWNGIITFAIITMPANELMRYVHNTKERMPVVIDRNMIEDFIDPTVDPTPFFQPRDELPLDAQSVA